MTVVSINLSQQQLDTAEVLRAASGPTTLGGIVDLFFRDAYAFSAAHPYYSAYSSAGSSLRFDFADAATLTYAGVSNLNAGPASGTASASASLGYLPANYLLSVVGNLALNYSYSAAGALLYSSGAGTLTAATRETLLPSANAAYDKTLGNLTQSMNGALLTDPGGGFSGTLTSVTQSADRYLTLEKMAGSFSVSGNAAQIGQQAAMSSLSGTLTSYSASYADGSHFSIAGANIPVTDATPFDRRLLANPANFPGADQISVALAQNVTGSYLIASGAGNDSVTLAGGGGALGVQAGDGNDTIVLRDSGHAVDGGAGIDTVIYPYPLADYAIARTGSGLSVSDTARGGTDALANVEALKFSDLAINLTVQADAASIAPATLQRLEEFYVAFFNRVPDANGLQGWIDQTKAGRSLNQIADDFYSAGLSFSAVTGYSSAMSNDDFVKLIYKNVLGRSDTHNPPTATDVSYWSDGLAAGRLTRGTLINTILDAAHTYKGDATWGWVPDTLDNKIAVGNQFAVVLGLGYIADTDSITQGMAIAAAVTATDKTAAIALIGVATGPHIALG